MYILVLLFLEYAATNYEFKCQNKSFSYKNTSICTARRISFKEHSRFQQSKLTFDSVFETSISNENNIFLCVHFPFMQTSSNGDDDGGGGGGANEEQLSIIYDALRKELPQFFVTQMNYRLVHKDVVFENRIRGKIYQLVYVLTKYYTFIVRV